MVATRKVTATVRAKIIDRALCRERRDRQKKRVTRPPKINASQPPRERVRTKAVVMRTRRMTRPTLRRRRRGANNRARLRGRIMLKKPARLLGWPKVPETRLTRNSPAFICIKVLASPKKPSPKVPPLRSWPMPSKDCRAPLKSRAVTTASNRRRSCSWLAKYRKMSQLSATSQRTQSLMRKGISARMVLSRLRSHKAPNGMLIQGKYRMTPAF